MEIKKLSDKAEEKLHHPLFPENAWIIYNNADKIFNKAEVFGLLNHSNESQKQEIAPYTFDKVLTILRGKEYGNTIKNIQEEIVINIQQIAFEID